MSCCGQDNKKPYTLTDALRDALNGHIEYAPKSLAEQRLDTCRLCIEYVPLVALCNQCKCYMHTKVKLAKASCPLEKWEK